MSTHNMFLLRNKKNISGFWTEFLDFRIISNYFHPLSRKIVLSRKKSRITPKAGEYQWERHQFLLDILCAFER